ncbi:MAG: hypothetical protein CME06_00130 [Gemmatimonadetes bacterium]|nr:hypothetical protein [Gemmatimonadota bacterium]
MSPTDGQADYKTPEQLLGTILTNMSSTCKKPAPTRDWIEMAKMSCGYRSVRHANEGMGWAELITKPRLSEPDTLKWPTTMWTKEDCDNDITNAFAWWTHMYGGTVDQTLYMDQVGRIDVFGPHGAGWKADWIVGESRWDDLVNTWTGDYFSFEGVFDDDVTTATTVAPAPGFALLPVWRTWVDLTVSTYDPAFADTTTNELRGRFWGMDPVRVIIDESAIAVPDLADGKPVRNKAEVQANYGFAQE